MALAPKAKSMGGVVSIKEYLKALRAQGVILHLHVHLLGEENVFGRESLETLAQLNTSLEG